MGDFVGRDHEIASLARLLDQVRGEIGTAKPGRCLLMRGRRRIGNLWVEHRLGRAARGSHTQHDDRRDRGHTRGRWDLDVHGTRG